MLYSSLSRVVATILIGLAGMSLGCSDSPSTLPPTAPTPAAPTVLTVTSVSPSSGPTSGGDWIRISGNRFQSDTTVTLDGVAAEVRCCPDMFVMFARTPAHAVGTVDVVVTNLDGQTAKLQGAYTYAAFSVTASPNVVAPGADLTVSFSAPSGRGCSGGGDWIAIFPLGAPDETGAANGHSDLWYDHLCGAASGTLTAKAPSEPGRYEFRYMTGTFSSARSSPFDVRAPTAVRPS